VREWESCGEEFLRRVCARGGGKEVERVSELDQVKKGFEGWWDGYEEGSEEEGVGVVSLRIERCVGIGVEVGFGVGRLFFFEMENSSLLRWLVVGDGITCCMSQKRNYQMEQSNEMSNVAKHTALRG